MEFTRDHVKLVTEADKLTNRRQELERLRSEVRKRQGHARAKETRLKKKYNLTSLGKYSALRADAQLGRYTTRQLLSYMKQLNKFMEDKRSFVPDMRGRAMDERKYLRYRREAEKYNKRVAAWHHKYSTVPDRYGQTSMDRKMMLKDHGFYNPKTPKKKMGVEFHEPLKPDNFAGEKAVGKIGYKLKEGATPRDLNKRRFAAMDQFNQMTEPLPYGDELRVAFYSLTQEQRDYVWNETDFTDLLSEDYDEAVGGGSFFMNREELFEIIDDARRMFPEEGA